MRLGILGGSFDPIHFGHLLVATDVTRKLKLDKLLFIPTFRPPHRSKPVAAYPHRVAMVKSAILKAYDRFEVSRIEENRPGPSYTINTLQRLRHLYPFARFYLIIGYDQYRTIGTWHHPQQLTALARLVVISRPGISQPAIFPGHNRRRVLFLDVIPVDISSSIIRYRLARNMSIRYLTPPPVVQYINRYRLYMKK